MIKYYKDTNNVIRKLEEDANNTIEQILLYNDDLIEEMTEDDYLAQENAIKTSDEYIALQRRTRYEEEVPMGDQLDALWKALSGMDNLPQEALDVLSKREKIKQDLPKNG